MKKLILPLLFVFGFFLFPIDTFAESVSGSTTYYYSRCYYANGNTYCDSPDSSMTSYKSPFTSYEWTPTNDSTNYIFYLVKMQDVQVSYNFQTGKVYTITLNYDHGSNIKTSSGLYLFGRSNNITCSQGACSVSWENKDSEHTTATVTFLPNNNYSSIIFGLGDSTSNNLGLFANVSDLGQGLRINNAQISSTSSSTDITPIVTEQQKTNDKLDDVNDNLDIVNDNISDTNDKLDSIGDQLVDDTAPTNNEIETFKGNLPALSFGPISNALQMPIQYINYWYEQFRNHTCTPINFGSLLGTDLTLPCMNPLNDYLNTNTTMGGLNSFIGIVCALFIYYNTALLVVHAWDTWTSFADDFTGLYRPPGDSYHPKHAKGGGN